MPTNQKLKKQERKNCIDKYQTHYN